MKLNTATVKMFGETNPRKLAFFESYKELIFLNFSPKPYYTVEKTLLYLHVLRFEVYWQKKQIRSCRRARVFVQNRWTEYDRQTLAVQHSVVSVYRRYRVLTNKRSVCLSIATTARSKSNSLLVMAMPIPPLAPVTNATLPFHRFMSAVLMTTTRTDDCRGSLQV